MPTKPFGFERHTKKQPLSKLRRMKLSRIVPKYRLASTFFVGLVFLFGCASTAPTFVPVLGSSHGLNSDKIEIIKDVRVSNLRIRQVRIKNQDQCISGYRDELQLDGEINSDSTFIVEKLLVEIPKCLDKTDHKKVATGIYMNSGGGLLKDGFKLGIILRQQGVSASVIEGQVCASSCAVAFLGAQFRTVSGTGVLSFHSPYQNSGIGINCASITESSELKRYFEGMLGGLSGPNSKGQVLFDRAMSYCSSSAGWTINGDAAKIYGIATF